MPTPSMEDHLEKIYQISQDKGYARVTDIAQALGLQLPSVSRMMQKMGDEKLVRYEKYGGVVLTDKGKKLGAFLNNRHDVLEEFLRILGVEDEQVIYQDVEGMEHYVSQETFWHITQFVNFSKGHPDWMRQYLSSLRQSKKQLSKNK